MTTTDERVVIERPKAKMAIEHASLEWIPADAFTTDESYDRPPHEARMNHMAENWNDGALGVVFGSRRENDPYVYLLDGQHRVGALRKLGRKKDLVPTLVFEGLTVAQEAELFVMMNKNRRALTPSELFRASLVEGDKGAIEIKEVMDGLGLELESHGGQPNQVKCVASIQRIYKAMGAAGVDATLGLILVTWGDPPLDGAFNQQMVMAIAKLLHYNENRIDIDHLRKALGKETPDSLLSRAASIQALQGGERTRVLIDTIVNVYNKGMSPTRQVQAPPRSTKDPFTIAARFDRAKPAKKTTGKQESLVAVS